MGFSVKWQSIAGMITSEFEAPTYLEDIENERAEPGAGQTNSFALWNQYIYDASLTPSEFSKLAGIMITWLDITDYFTGSSQGYPKKLCEFQILNSSLAPSGGMVTFGLEGYLTSGLLYLSPFKSIYDAQMVETKTTVGQSEAISSSILNQLKIVAGGYKRNSYDYFGLGFSQTNYNNVQMDSRIWYMTTENFTDFFGGEPEGDATSPEFGKKAKTKGGYNRKSRRKGTFDDSSDTITPSSAPTLSAFTSGLMHAYKVTDAELSLLSEAMYPDLIFNATSVTDALGSLFDAIFMSKYVDYLLDLMILPINVPAPTSEWMRVGGKTLTVSDGSGGTSHISSHRVSNQYVDVNCGSVTIPEYWANFLDFSGTRFKLFLPYIGYVDIQPEYINGGNLKVKYRFNVLDGSFICFVISSSGHSELTESMIGQYSGVAAMHIPLQSTDYSNKVSGLISSMGAVAAGAASGGMSGAVGYGAAASMVNTVIAKPGSSHANGYNASSSFLSHRVPYLIIERQSSQFSEKYPEEKGLPLFMEMKIGDCKGLTICDNPHLDTIPATVEEKEMIFKYLTEGIIV